MASTDETFVLKVNGAEHTVKAPGTRSLLTVLRDDLGLTGTKFGCGEGECGACTVLLDGRATRSCVLPISAAAGRSVITVEGLAAEEKLHPVQEAFLEAQAFQCGYCTPGMVMTTVDLLQHTPHPTKPQIREALAGNLCRCAAYTRILRAVQLAAEKMGS
jgi:aerobic-type carbon monoxide dehydrogenase small subunit (CoxS/CutS family)